MSFGVNRVLRNLAVAGVFHFVSVNLADTESYVEIDSTSITEVITVELNSEADKPSTESLPDDLEQEALVEQTLETKAEEDLVKEPVNEANTPNLSLDMENVSPHLTQESDTDGSQTPADISNHAELPERSQPTLDELISRLEATPAYQASQWQIEQERLRQSTEAMHQELQTTEAILEVASRISQYGAAAHVLLEGDDISSVITTLQETDRQTKEKLNTTNTPNNLTNAHQPAAIKIPKPTAQFIHRSQGGVYRARIRIGEHEGDLFEGTTQTWGSYKVTLMSIEPDEIFPIHLRVNQQEFAIAVQ